MTDIQEPQEEAATSQAPLRTFVKDDLEISTNVPVEINNLLCGGWQEANAPSVEEAEHKLAPEPSAAPVPPEQERPTPTPAAKAKTGKDK